MLRTLLHRPEIAPLTALIFLAAYFAIGFHSMVQQSTTYDEARHWKYGLRTLAGNTSRFDDSKMPITALNAIPFRLKQALWPQTDWSIHQTLESARCLTLLAGVLLGWLVFAWARAVGGSRAGLIALGLFLVDPNLAAHAQWVTTDIYGALGITLSVYCFWRFLVSPGTLRGLLTGLAIGLALVSKFTAAYLFILLPLLTLTHWLSQRRAQDNRKWLESCIIHTPILINTFFIILAAGYLGNGWGSPLSAYEFKSDLFITLQEAAGKLAHIPLPFPKPFIEGLDWVKFFEGASLGRGPGYLFGELSRDPFPNYYFWVFWYKVPIGILLMLGWAVVESALRALRQRRLSSSESLPLLTALFFMVYFNYFCNAQMGIRHLLVIFPAFYVFTGITLSKGFYPAAANEPANRINPLPCWLLLTLRACAVTILMFWAALSVASHYPHLTAYFNEMAGKPIHYYRILADSNLEWGQNNFFVDRYKKAHPDIQINPAYPYPGRIVISANFMLGIVLEKKYTWARWLREHKEPVGHIGYGLLIYDLTEDDITQIRSQYSPREPSAIDSIV
jgi:hypothetical protein